MATIRELVTKWGFDIDDKKLQATEKQFSALQSSMTVLAGGAAAAAATLFGFVKTTANAGDEAFKTSQKIGVGVEELQELQYAAKLADVSNESLATGLKILNKNINESAEAGSAQAKTFKALGIMTKDISGKFKGADAILTEVADKFKTLEDGPKKTALAMELFGKSGADLIPLLNGGSASISELRNEARELGLVLDGETAAASEQFNDSLTKIMSVGTGIRNMLGAELIPLALELSNQFFEFVKANRALIALKIKTVLGFMVNFLKAALVFIGPLVKGVFSFVGALLSMKKTLTALGTVIAAYFIGGAIQSALAILPVLIFKAVAAFQALTLSAIMAKLAIFAIPALIGAAFILLALIIEDIIAFFQGKNSVTGIIVEKFKAMFLYLQEGFNKLGSGAKNALVVLLTPIRAIINGFQNILNLVDVLRGKMSLKEFGGKFLGGLANTFGFGASENLRSAVGLEGTSSLSQVAGVTPQPGVGVLAPSSSSASQKNNVNVDVTVNANGRDDAAKVGAQVGKQTGSEVDAIMRETFRNFQGAGGY